MLKVRTLAVLTLLASSQGRWKEIGKTNTGNPVFVDPKSVSKGKDGIITATVRVAYATPVKIPQGELTASRAIAMFNCQASKFAVKESTLYFDEKANKIYQRKVNKIPGYGVTIAGNFADVAMKSLCAK